MTKKNDTLQHRHDATEVRLAVLKGIIEKGKFTQPETWEHIAKLMNEEMDSLKMDELYHITTGNQWTGFTNRKNVGVRSTIRLSQIHRGVWEPVEQATTPAKLETPALPPSDTVTESPNTVPDPDPSPPWLVRAAAPLPPLPSTGMRHIGVDLQGMDLYLTDDGRVVRVLVEEVS